MPIDPATGLDTPPLPSPEANKRRDKNRVTILSLILVGCGIVSLLYTPFWPLESAIYIAGLCSPLYLLAYRPVAGFIASGSAPDAKRVLLGLACCVLVGALVSVAFVANVTLDSSEAEQQPFVILYKDWSTHKNSRTYKAHIAHPFPSPLPFGFSDTESITIGKSDYDRVTEGSSKIVLTLHQGFLGMPWYETRHSFIGLSATTSIPAQTSRQRTEAETAACQWRDHFSVEREIEAIEPDDYIRDYWGNHAPRSIEPTVHGERHGIAHYTFANGELYSDIPWKHGQKHGTFILHREDGSVEQRLSYRDGELYGINEWYDEKGALKTRLLYLNSSTTENAHICDGVLP